MKKRASFFSWMIFAIAICLVGVKCYFTYEHDGYFLFVFSLISLLNGIILGLLLVKILKKKE